MGRGKKYTDDYKEMISDLYKSGMTIPEINSEYGIADGILYTTTIFSISILKK